MRIAALGISLAALVAAGAAGWVLLRPVPSTGAGEAPAFTDPDRVRPVAPGEMPLPTGTEGPSARAGSPRLPGRGATPPIPGPPRERPSRDGDPASRLREKDAVPSREPKPLPEGVMAGEVTAADPSEDEAKRIEETRGRLQGKQVPSIHYRGRSLRKAAAELAEASGVAIELSGEDLEDEPLEGLFPDTDAFDRLVRIATERNLRFEVHPDRVVIRR